MTTWSIDTSHSSVSFSVRHMMFAKVRGSFGTWSADVTSNDDATAGSVKVAIDVASIDTKEEKRDAHLRSADFFDVENHPTMSFASTGFERSGDAFKLAGDLTIRGTTKPVTLSGKFLGSGVDPWGNKRLLFEGSTTIDRFDFGLTWSQALETGGVLVGREIEITVDIQLVGQG